MKDPLEAKVSPVSKPSDARSADCRIPSLDGLRALSIILVLLGHLSGTRGFVILNLQIGEYARLGVMVFFVISGLLITKLLSAEREKYGKVSLKRFYERRAVRLFPASFVYIFVVALLWMAGVLQLHNGDLWHAVTYTTNFAVGRSWVLGHLWSLSVEEQFYLLWPLAFVLLSPKRALWVVIGVIAIAPVARAGARLFLSRPYRELEMFPMVADSLAFGCLLAMVKDWLERQSAYLRLFRPAPSLTILGLVLLTNRYMPYTIVAAFGTTIINASIAVLIHRCVNCPSDRMGRFLNWRPFAFIGMLSYSLYVWQQLFLNHHSNAWACSFPENLGFAVAAALGSYFLLEKPLLTLRRRLRA